MVNDHFCKQSKAGTPSKDNGIGDALGPRMLSSQKPDQLGEESHVWGQVGGFLIQMIERI